MRIALCLLLLPCLATADDTPAPVLEYTFDEGVPEGAEVVDYALGEGLVLLPGPWRDCLDLTAASRFGGTLEQTDPAGGALFVRDEQIDNLTDFTVTFWAMGQGADEAINARLLNRMGSWELIYAYGRFGALLVNGDRKTNHAVPPATNPNEWAFHAVTLDVGALKLATYTGDAAGGLAASREYDIPEPPDNTAGELQIGTFGGVRPFRGKLDNPRIFGSALSPEQVAGVFDADVAAQGAGWVYSTGMPAMPARPFMLKPSDIVLSSRWQTRKKAEAFDLIRACHVDHLLWVYGNDPAYIREAKALGVTYQGTLNGLAGWDRATPDLSAEGDTTGRQQDFDGNKVVLGHMRKWTPEHPRWTGNHNSDAFRAIFFEECDRLIEAGIDSLHIDDWEMAASTVSYGISGFSPESLANFTQYLDDNVSAEGLAALGIADLGDFDYREYLRN
ncbi:MAG TPA: LamG-like jellyroll fold domain-containing protein, partial [Armatimonadota bacterium]|nr:LamG-like jellyroll fold domain-containing protein [Armatimonadota bacterium]